jgi:hypothetical protein
MEVVSPGGEVDESVNGGCYDFRAETGWLVGSRFGKEKGRGLAPRHSEFLSEANACEIW